MRRKEQRSMLMLAIVMAFVLGVFLAGPVGAKKESRCSALKKRAEKWGCPVALVEKTGQTELYVTGDDGDLEKGVAWSDPRFTDNGDGTVTDNLTGLIWLKNANCFGTRTWAQALSDCNNLADSGDPDLSCGLTDSSSAGDWRLPNVKELQSLIDYGVYNPALPNTDGTGTGQWSEDDPFSGVVSHFYWSSTTFASPTDDAWFVYLGYGHVSLANKYDAFYVWPVRGGQ